MLWRDPHRSASSVAQASGCVCCKVRGDLAAALKRLAVDLAASATSAESETGADGAPEGEGDVDSGGGAIEAVLIETSGLSEVRRPTWLVGGCVTSGRLCH